VGFVEGRRYAAKHFQEHDDKTKKAAEFGWRSELAGESGS
jgi:hypothetical protein